MPSELPDDISGDDQIRVLRAQKYAADPDDVRADAADKGTTLMALCERAGVPYDPETFRDLTDRRIAASVLHALVHGLYYQEHGYDLSSEQQEFLRGQIARYAPAECGPADVPLPDE